MATYPKNVGDELTATDWNIVAAQAAAAAPAIAALADVASSGEYDDLANRPVIENDADNGFVIADTYGEVALRIGVDGVTEIAQAEVDILVAGGATTTEDTAVGVAWAVADPYGNISLQVGTDGKAGVPGMTFGAAPAGYALMIADGFGNIAGAITEEGVGSGIFGGASGGGSSTSGYTSEEQARRAARALALSAAVIGQTNTTAARPVWEYNHVMAYGQSLSTGWEGWPSLSKTQPFDSVMLGTSDHPASETSSAWVQIGTLAFNPLVATVESGGALASDVTVAAYTAGNTARGESAVVGAVNFWRKQQLAWRGLTADASRVLVASSCGVGGKTIAELSSGASPNLFNRLIDCAELAVSLAGTYGVAGILFLQGESDAVNGATDKDTYKASLATLQQDIFDDVAVAIAGQSAPPAIFSYQTASIYVRDSNNLAVSQAQLEAAQEFRDFYLACPAYPVTDKSGHLDPNGYRWLGQQFGKVMHQVLDLGRGWKPVHPIRATYRGVEVLIDFHVPQPPLQFQPCYVGTTATTYADKGFKVTDDGGTITISSVAIVSDGCVLITLAAEPGTNPYVWYGAQTPSAGNGNLCDSDPTVASDLYEYTSGTGQYAGAEIAALEDDPYPLWNWCCLFRLAIEHDPPT